MRRRVQLGVAGRSRTGRNATLLLLSGLFCIVSPSDPLAAQERVVSQSAASDPINAHVAEAARRRGRLRRGGDDQDAVHKLLMIDSESGGRDG